MPEAWHGIQDYRFIPKPKPAPADNTRVVVQDEEGQDTAKKKPEAMTIELKNGKFLPDDKTDFLKPCKVEVDVIGEKPGKVNFELWVTYNGKEIALKVKGSGDTNKGKASCELNLEYLDEYHKDVTENGKADAKIDYFVKMTSRGAKLATGEKMAMPRIKVTSLTDSVGQGGKNKSEDVKIVQQKLKDLAYPVSSVSGTCDAETIKAIKFFQAVNTVFPVGSVNVDGIIDKGGKMEKKLFDSASKKYVALVQGAVKPLEASIEKKKNDALSGTDTEIKNYWQKVMDVWNVFSPYLPAGSRMESGYRSSASQRSQLYSKYNNFKTQITAKFDAATWKKYSDMQETEMTAAELASSDKEMHRQICEAVSSNEVALPGKSKHEFGQALDSQVADVNERVQATIWYQISFGTIRNIKREANNCVHCEFD